MVDLFSTTHTMNNSRYHLWFDEPTEGIWSDILFRRVRKFWKLWGGGGKTAGTLNQGDPIGGFGRLAPKYAPPGCIFPTTFFYGYFRVFGGILFSVFDQLDT